jgi:hypothetical protein
LRISSSHLLGLASDGQEKLELGRELVFCIEAVREVDSSYSAVSVDLNSQSLDVVSTVGTTGEITQVELNLVPALIQTHGHGTDEGLHSGGRLVIRGAETTSNVLIVEHLHLEGEILLQLLTVIEVFCLHS